MNHYSITIKSLVGGLDYFVFFHNSWEIFIIPTDFHIFLEELKHVETSNRGSTTNQITIFHH